MKRAQDRIPNFSIFEKDSEYWKMITDNGSEPVPTFVLSVIICNGRIIEERKHPVRVLEEGKKWMTNYSDTI